MLMKIYGSMAEYYQDMAPKPQAEGQWQTVDPNATYPFERHRAIRGRREYRVCYGRGSTRHPDLPWILVVREIGEDGVLAHIHHGAYRTDHEAKLGAVQWDGPPPQ